MTRKYRHARKPVTVDLEFELAGEIGIGFFKRISRGIKKGVKGVAKVGNVVQAVGKAAKAVVKSPYLKAAVGGLAMVMPVMAPVAAGLVAADKLISAAENAADKARQLTAVKMIRATAALAKSGNKDAARAFKALAVVRKKKQELNAMTPAQRAERARAMALKEREQRALLAAAKAAKNAPKLDGYLVTKDGRIVRGRYLKG